MSDWAADEVPCLAEIVVGSGSYKHAAPTELGEPCSPCGYKHAAPDGAVGGGPSGIAP